MKALPAWLSTAARVAGARRAVTEAPADPTAHGKKGFHSKVRGASRKVQQRLKMDGAEPPGESECGPDSGQGFPHRHAHALPTNSEYKMTLAPLYKRGSRSYLTKVTGLGTLVSAKAGPETQFCSFPSPCHIHILRSF